MFFCKVKFYYLATSYIIASFKQTQNPPLEGFTLLIRVFYLHSWVVSQYKTLTLEAFAAKLFNDSISSSVRMFDIRVYQIRGLIKLL